jgi:hypothetical protein
MNRYIRRIVFSLLLQALISLAAWHRGWLSVEIFHWLTVTFQNSSPGTSTGTVLDLEAGIPSTASISFPIAYIAGAALPPNLAGLGTTKHGKEIAIGGRRNSIRSAEYQIGLLIC